MKREGVSFIGIQDSFLTDQEYFSIHEYLFERILATHYNVGIKLKIISKDVSSQTNKKFNMKKLIKSNKTIYFTKTCHNIHRKK